MLRKKVERKATWKVKHPSILHPLVCYLPPMTLKIKLMPLSQSIRLYLTCPLPHLLSHFSHFLYFSHHVLDTQVFCSLEESLLLTPGFCFKSFFGLDHCYPHFCKARSVIFHHFLIEEFHDHVSAHPILLL